MFTIQPLHLTVTENFQEVLRSATKLVRHYWEDEQGRDKFVRELLDDTRDSSQLFWVATIGDWVIGIVGLCPGNFSFHSFAIPWLLVHPQYRRIGCGQALIQATETYIRDTMGTGVVVCCTPHVGLLKKWGFSPAVLMPDRYHRVMCKTIEW